MDFQQQKRPLTQKRFFLKAKGQLISKTIYGVLDSPKKRTKKNHSSNKSIFFHFFVRFLEKLGKQKLLSRLSDL